MALPPNGWAVPVRAAFAQFPLPEEMVVAYRDTFRFGKVTNVVIRKAGQPFIVDRSGFRLIDIELHFQNVHDVALIDRIE